MYMAQGSTVVSERQKQYRLWDVKRRRREGDKGEENTLPDNYTDENFLRDLVINANVKRRRYGKVVWDSQCLVQQLCIASLVPATFLHLKSERLSVSSLLYLNCGILVTACLALLLVTWKDESKSCWTLLLRFLRQCFLLLTGLYNLSPLYQKLTSSISSDTIGASSVVLLALHLFLHDYGFERSITETIFGSVSLGAAIATSVLLSSRLDTAHQVFCYLSFALGLFVLSPFLRKDLEKVSPRVYLINTLAMFGVTLRAIGLLSMPLATFFVLLTSFTSFACPWLLISVEKHKVQINGPWDEAQIS